MFSTGKLQCNMSSTCFFPTQKQINSFPFQNSVLNNNNQTSINNSSSSSINSISTSRSSTPDSTLSQQSLNSNNSNSISSNNSNNINNLDYLSLLAENERLKLEISQLKNINNNENIIKICNNAIQQADYYMKECNKYKALYLKMKKKKEEEDNKLQEERKKKRKFAHILYEFGCSNKTIRNTMGDFEYSAEIKKYNVPKVTKLRWQTEVYNIRDRVGYKEVEFTNSSDLSLDINDLKIIDSKNQNVNIKFSIKKLKSSFGCIYEDNNNDNYHYKSHNSKRNCYKPRRVSSKNDCHQDNIICPDDHFLICFEHPIKQEEGIHSLSYRLFSAVKARTHRYKGNGAFGQKIDFDYEVKNY